MLAEVSHLKTQQIIHKPMEHIITNYEIRKPVISPVKTVRLETLPSSIHKPSNLQQYKYELPEYKPAPYVASTSYLSQSVLSSDHKLKPSPVRHVAVTSSNILSHTPMSAVSKPTVERKFESNINYSANSKSNTKYSPRPSYDIIENKATSSNFNRAVFDAKLSEELELRSQNAASRKQSMINDVDSEYTHLSSSPVQQQKPKVSFGFGKSK